MTSQVLRSFLLALVALFSPLQAVSPPPLVEMAWRAALSPQPEPPVGTPWVSDGRLFVLTTQIEAHSTSDGKLLWSVPVEKYLPRALLGAGERVFVIESTIAALDVRTGRKLWEFTPDANASFGRATVSGDRLYFGTVGARLYALNPATGKKLWATDLGMDWKYNAVVRGVAVEGGTVFAAVEQWRSENGEICSGWLIAVNAGDGTVLWRYHTGSGLERRGFSSSPVVSQELVLAADYLDNAITAVDRRNGKEVWRFQGKKGYVGFPEAPLVAQGRVYAGSGDTHVYALELATGRRLWEMSISSTVEAYALCGKNLMINDQGISVLDIDSGRLNRRFFQGGTEFPTSDFAAAGNRSYALGPQAIYAFACQ